MKKTRLKKYRNSSFMKAKFKKKKRENAVVIYFFN